MSRGGLVDLLAIPPLLFVVWLYTSIISIAAAEATIFLSSSDESNSINWSSSGSDSSSSSDSEELEDDDEADYYC